MIYSNLKKYNSKGQRLAIFGRSVSDDQIEVLILTCSKRDQFTKKTAKEVYDYYVKTGENTIDLHDTTYHPTVLTIPIREGKPKVSFLSWCKSQYYSMVDRNVVIQGKIKGVYYERLKMGGQHLRIKCFTK